MPSGDLAEKMVRSSGLVVLGDAVALSLATMVVVPPSAIGATYAIATLLIMWISGAYRPRMYHRLSPRIPTLLGQLTIATLIAAFWPGLTRLTLIEHLPATVLLVIAIRLLTYSLQRTLTLHLEAWSDALIIGTAQHGPIVAEALLRHRECGIRPVGFVDSGPAGSDSPLPVVADLATIEEVIETLGIKHIILAGSADGQIRLATILWHCQARNVEVWVVPPLFEFGVDPCGRATDDVWAIPFQHLRRPKQHTAARRLKRAFDIAVCAGLLILASPLFLLVALAVRMTSPGPILFRQKRIGQGGREMELFKFRSMMVNEDSDTTWSVHNDHRMTPIGRFLRRSCLDELPQLLNVIRGDMSLVGPRPERPHFATQFSASVPHYGERLRGPVGITGWAQIHGLRGDTSIAERIRFDNFYIEHWSLSLDALILARTVSALFKWVFLSNPPTTAAVTPSSPVVKGDGARTAPVLAEAGQPRNW